LATQEWVDNHWSLILWKLAGMTTLNPECEVDVHQRRWSWVETMRQLRYRYVSPLMPYYVNPISNLSYEKELNCGARPALRLIAAQDVSAALHMILCISDISWSGSGIGDDGLPLVPHPTLELTDGWYRLRAQVDEVLARAARRGVIRVGRKISVSGASVRFWFSFLTPQGLAYNYNQASAEHRTLRGIGSI
jgi:breast cancer 2 susceptibility protein